MSTPPLDAHFRLIGVTANPYPYLRRADIVFGQLETSFAEKGVRLPQARHAVLARPDGAAALGRAGFEVISMAGNHVMDWGHEAFFETRTHIEAAGMNVVGAGANIAEARRPVIRTLGDGTRVDIDLCHSCLKETLGPWLRLSTSAWALAPKG